MMTKQIVLSLFIVLAFGILAYSFSKIFAFFRLTKAHRVGNYRLRLIIMLKIAIGQTKIFRRPVLGLLHALVFWGFCIILFGSLEMMIDGVSGMEKSFSFLGGFYTVIMAGGDVFALLVLISVLVFLFRRIFLNVKRFSGIEMKHNSHVDANIA
ncbi:MAG: hypothetical protein WC599_12215, partial [Bacteroidales bacterium]